MDLGTIKAKLEKNIYFSKEEFAADVRLTFSNAMTYNPPTNDVHLMAKELNKLFDRKWKDMDKKWNFEDELGQSETGITKETVRKSCTGTQSRHKDSLSKKSRASEPKGIHKISSMTTRDAKVSVVFCEGEKPYCNMQKLCNIFTEVDIKLMLLPTLLSTFTLL
jgi:hypothetical protein